MAKITPRMEKKLERRKKWLEGRKNLSRVTRAQVSEQNAQATAENVSSQSTTSLPKSKHSPSQTNHKKSGKPTASHSQEKNVESKHNASSNHSDVSKQSAKKSRYNNNNSEVNSVDTDKGSKEKSSVKKAKQIQMDAVEKLNTSSSIHVPKKLLLFVGNLSEDITKEQLMTHFKKAGCGVKSVRLPKYRGTETGKGYGYVEFANTIGHRIGLRMNNTTLAGRKIVVEFASDGKMTEKQLLEKVKQKDEEEPMKMPFDA